MSKSLYSVILSDEVVRQIDRMALSHGTNRSGLINRILAEYVSYTTPEMRIDSIFRTIEDFFRDGEADLVPMLVPHQSTMSVKGSLDYRYRPTVRYDVELYREPAGDAFGRLSVVFRTQSDGLLAEMTRFFRLWAMLEDSGRYRLADGRFTRELVLRAPEADARTIADAISSYVRLLDRCLNGFISGQMTEKELTESIRLYKEKEGMIL